jgi:rubrerythrin
MDKITFNKILDFAVEREREAVDFYHDLQKSVKFTAYKTMLQELENMEKGHILILEKMRQKNFTEIGSKTVKDLKVVDYLTDEDIKPDSYHNILLIAMQREDKANLLYRDLANRFAEEDEELSKLFARLAAEEAGHKLKFEKLYDDYVLKDN